MRIKQSTLADILLYLSIALALLAFVIDSTPRSGYLALFALPVYGAAIIIRRWKFNVKA